MNRQTILIIDDDPAQQEILGEHLLLTGFTPLHATSGDQAFALLKTNPVDLILLDINMPHVDGFQVMEQLRNRDDTRDIPVLFLTSLDRQYLKIKGLELGADDYVTKPYNSAELIARIKAILRRSVQHRMQPGTIQGDIHAIGISELLQNIGQSGRVATIELPDMQGFILTAEGNILKICQGKFTGIAALLRLFLLEKGRFSVQYDRQPETLPEPENAIFTALLTTASLADEIRARIEESGKDNPLLTIASGDGLAAAIAQCRQMFPLSLLELICLMDGEIEENLGSVLKAIANNQLQPLPPGGQS